ncbi:ssDNA binding protein [Microbacterium phage LeeroyJenkins]|nr:ssDNA binding protein [Microbacterium phage LeeroyJenkins]
MAGTKTASYAEALAAFQADLPAVGLDGTNPHFNSKFATLANVTKEVFPKLSAVGLTYTVGSRISEAGTLVVVAKLLHTSGEFQTAEFPIVDTNPQKVGSAITYYRRYGLASLTGVVADVDDDGNTASQQTVAEKRAEQARQTPQPAQAAARTQDSDSQAAVRKWIGNDDARKEQANAARERIKKEQNLSGEALFAAVKAEVGA